jgi:hypothetical protein
MESIETLSSFVHVLNMFFNNYSMKFMTELEEKHQHFYEKFRSAADNFFEFTTTDALWYTFHQFSPSNHTRVWIIEEALKYDKQRIAEEELRQAGRM